MVGAIRLPNDAFKKNANTEVTTDIVILRKRLPGELPSGQAWRQTTEITNSLGETIPINEYFAAHPEMMLGELRLEGRMYARSEPTLVGAGVGVAAAAGVRGARAKPGRWVTGVLDMSGVLVAPRSQCVHQTGSTPPAALADRNICPTRAETPTGRPLSRW